MPLDVVHYSSVSLQVDYSAGTADGAHHRAATAGARLAIVKCGTGSRSRCSTGVR
jgi:hypothetical protein